MRDHAPPRLTPCCADGCANEGAFRCKGCDNHGAARYCSRACQLRDWKDGHKLTCGTCVACGERPGPSARACPGPPRHAEMDLVRTLAQFTPRHFVEYACERCEGKITRETLDGEERQVGPAERCGTLDNHVMHRALMGVNDLHVGREECVVLIPASAKDRERLGMDAQKALDDIPEDAERIVIRGIGGYCEDAGALRFPNKTYPKVTHLRIHDVCMKSLTLTDEFFPRLNGLDVDNSLHACAASGDLKIILSALNDLKLYRYQGPRKVIQDMLVAAKKLIAFDASKLCLDPSPGDDFAALDLTHSFFLYRIRLHRADTLGELTIRAPYLQELTLHACWNLRVMDFVPPYGSEDSIRKQLVESDVRDNEHIDVSIKLSKLGERALAALREHPRVDPLDINSSEDRRSMHPNFNSRVIFREFNRVAVNDSSPVEVLARASAATRKKQRAQWIHHQRLKVDAAYAEDAGYFEDLCDAEYVRAHLSDYEDYYGDDLGAVIARPTDDVDAPSESSHTSSDGTIVLASSDDDDPPEL